MPASSWWDKSTGFALLTILLWASLAALTSRITSVSPLVLVGLVLLFCGAGTLPFWRQWRASPLTWLVTITALLLYHLLLFTSFRHAPVLEANLINYLWPLCIILFTPLLLPGHPLSLHHLLAGALGLAGSVLVMVDGHLQLQQAHLPGYLLALGAAIVWGAYSVLSRRLPPAPAVVTAAACLPAGLLALLLAWMLEGPLPFARIPQGTGCSSPGSPSAPWGRPSSPGIWRCGTGIRAASARSPTSLPLLSTLLLVWLNGEALTPRHLLAGGSSWAAPCSACW